MSWYTVTKTIKGRQYLYLQMTYREGGRVRTQNKYLGPVSGGMRSKGSARLPRVKPAPYINKAFRDRHAELKRMNASAEAFNDLYERAERRGLDLRNPPSKIRRLKKHTTSPTSILARDVVKLHKISLGYEKLLAGADRRYTRTKGWKRAIGTVQRFFVIRRIKKEQDAAIDDMIIRADESIGREASPPEI